MKLVNVHFDEVVKEGSASWTGSASGSGSGAIKNLARSVFSPVDDVIKDYEQIPWSCKVEPEEDELSVGDRMSITIKDIKDSKGRRSRGEIQSSRGLQRVRHGESHRLQFL